jgi:hypothetical protein
MDKQQLKRALDAFTEHGINKIEVEFNGSGDSGQIDGMTYYSDEKSVTSRYMSGRERNSEGDYVTRPAERTLPPVDGRAPDAILEDFVYQELDASGIDWYNNDGGFGTYTFFLSNGTWRTDFEINVYYVESNTEHSASGPLFDDEADEEDA